MESNLTVDPSQDAEALLKQMEAAEPPPVPGPDAPGAASATSGDRAPDPAKDTDPAPPAQPDPQVAPTKPEDPPKPTEQKPTAEQPRDAKGKWAKDRERLNLTWDRCNERKSALDKSESELKLREQELTKRQQDLDRKAEELNRPRVTPERMESTALTWLTEAQAARDEAKRLEEAGDFAGAEAKNREAIIKAEKAREAREYANHLRANPPKPSPTAEQDKAAFEAAQKEWGQKAAIDFPQAFKQGTAEAKAMEDLIKAVPKISQDPEGIYYAARLISAEQTAIRALDWKAKFEAADAKVKKFEAKLAIPGGGAATEQSTKPDSQMTEQELEAQLRRETAGQRSSYQD